MPQLLQNQSPFRGRGSESYFSSGKLRLGGLDPASYLHQAKCLLPVDSGAQQRQKQHEEKNLQQSSGGGGDSFGSFGEQGEASIDEFYVGPVDE